MCVCARAGMSVARLMKAIRVREFGAPSVLRLCSDVAVPQPGHRQVRHTPVDGHNLLCMSAHNNGSASLSESTAGGLKLMGRIKHQNLPLVWKCASTGLTLVQACFLRSCRVELRPQSAFQITYFSFSYKLQSFRQSTCCRMQHVDK